MLGKLNATFHSLDPIEGTISFKLTQDNEYDITALAGLMEELVFWDKPMEIVLRRYFPQRSLSANKHCWVLCNRIAEALHQAGTSPIEVYRHNIRSTSTFKVEMVAERDTRRFIKQWESNGLGWFIELLDNKDGYNFLACYKGSSTYNSKQMARLIDELIQDARAVGLVVPDLKEVDYATEK